MKQERSATTAHRHKSNMGSKPSIAILGAGSFGTAIAIHLAKNGCLIKLWARDPSQVRAMQHDRMNTRYLQDLLFPENLTLTSDLTSAVTTTDFTIIAVPSHAFSALLDALPVTPKGLLWLTKGLDQKTGQLHSELVAKKFGRAFPVAMLSGPSFAREVALGLPTALTLATNNQIFLETLQACFHQNNLRIYPSADLLGVQIAATVKNVLAIACGVSDGLGCGANARAALITRGLSEMQRLGQAMGALTETFYGLAGLGDLVLTCTDAKSRNYRFGFLIGQGLEIDTAIKSIQQVIEGRFNTTQTLALAKAHRVEMPICKEVNAILTETKNLEAALETLMRREARFDENTSS